MDRERALISVILYGRNDSYGYNLHKRAALSLNCIAEMLDAPDDEILFVDYNTPDDFPTFPEAIRDTLTDRARRLLRILRVRPAQHRRFAELSHLVALEPVARNVAVRRSNPANRWILSTNTDMIFVPRDGRSLSAIAAPLADGYYHLSRQEIPESLWETLDRADAAGTIAAVGRWGWQFHLNEITEHGLPYLRYDAPGDFQLMLRSDAQRIWGFDERMLVGYHVDSNIAARLYQLYGTCCDVQDALFGYHCDHTRQITPAHRHDAPENDAQRFVFGIDDAFDARHQSETWGLAGETVEEVRLDGGRVTYLDALTRAITSPMEVPTRTVLAEDSIEHTDYDPRHVLPFLLDAVVEYPRGVVLGWFGTRADTLALFADAWRDLGFTGAILVPDDAPWLGETLPVTVAARGAADVVAEAQIFVLDGGLPAGHDPAVPAPHTPEMRHVTRNLDRVVAAERNLMPARQTAAARDVLAAHLRVPRRIIALNGFLNTWELLFGASVGAAKSPGSTRVRQGFALPEPEFKPPEPEKPLPPLMLHAGQAGTLLTDPDGPGADGQVRLHTGRRGLVLVVYQIGLPPGRWRFELDLAAPSGVPRPGPLKLELLIDGAVQATRYLMANGLVAQRLRIDFAMPNTQDTDDEDTVHEVRLHLHTIGLAGGTVCAVRLDRLGA